MSKKKKTKQVNKKPRAVDPKLLSNKSAQDWFLSLIASDSDSGSWGRSIRGNLYFVKAAGVGGPHF